MTAQYESSDMGTFGEFRPTAFDCRGLGSDGQEDWLVLPVSQTRDSEALAKSNFEAATKWLETEAEDEDWETHSFGHWGPGWFEIIVVRPGSTAHKIAYDIECALSDYPVLDDEDYSRREWEELSEWIDGEVSRIVSDYDGDLSEEYNTGDIANDLSWYSLHERSPKDEDVWLALVERGWFIGEE